MQPLTATLAINVILALTLAGLLATRQNSSVTSGVTPTRVHARAFASSSRHFNAFQQHRRSGIIRKQVPHAVTEGTHDGKEGSLQTLKLTHPSGSEATMYKFGAAVTSFKDASGTEWLAVRPDAKFDGSKAISGGIPHCFPQFGPGVLPQHGFARDAEWEVVKAEGEEVVFQLTDSEKTRALWDYPFKALYTVTLDSDSLKTKLEILNTGGKAFEFTGALHSYFDVSNINDVQIVGPFNGKTVLDRMQDPPANIVMNSDEIKISTETDQGWADTVLWNPYGNQNMGYEKFVCVEAAAAMKPVSVAPGSSWVADMELIPSAL
ncbi:hypothetical protein AAMO2058_001328900 [Amorphochlora amoebiformis]